jgi:CW-type Zinc Finger
MTCSLVPGGFLLSPIKGCFLNFAGKGTPMLKVARKTSQILAKSNRPTKEAKAHKSKNSRPDEKKNIHSDTKVLKDSPALPSQEQTSTIDLVKEKVELVEGVHTNASKSVENGDANPEVKPKLKSIKGDKKSVDSNKEKFKDSSPFDTYRKNKSESKKKLSISKADSVESNKNGDQYAGASNAMKSFLEVENAAEIKVQPQYDEKRVQKDKQSSKSTSTDRKKGSVMRSKKSDNLSRNELEKEFTHEFPEDHLLEKKNKSAGMKTQNGKDFTSLREALPKERPSNTRFEKEPAVDVKVNNPVPGPANLIAVEPLLAPILPMEIKENWVGCDKCHKWRLLPYWKIPDSLPKKWHCKLLDWL